MRNVFVLRATERACLHRLDIALTYQFDVEKHQHHTVAYAQDARLKSEQNSQNDRTASSGTLDTLNGCHARDDVDDVIRSANEERNARAT